MKKTLALILCLFLSFSFFGCAKQNSLPAGQSASPQIAEDANTGTDIACISGIAVMQDEKFDAVYVDISIEDFLSSGFSFGDSCDVVFSNGLSYTDIPFYNGYYVRTGLPLIVGYPGYPYLAVTRNNAGLWTDSGLHDGDSVTITLHAAGRFISVQEALSQSYSDERSEYSSDGQFANLRALCGGSLREDFLFRGASPCNNEKNRAPYANAFIEANGVRFILDLADTAADFEGYRAAEDFSSDYTAALYDSGSIALLGMGSSYGSDAYKQALASGLKAMLGAEGPVYIHCTEGKDRTGFVCVLLEALAGASYDEMLADYMKTYENYYGVNEAGTPDKYAAITDLYFDAFMAFLHGTEDLDVLKAADYSADAAAYLLSAGMSEDEINALTSMICK